MRSLALALLLAALAAAAAAAPPDPLPGASGAAEAAESAAGAAAEGAALAAEAQGLRREVLELNRELFRLEEELLDPSSTQVALFLATEGGALFRLDGVEVKLDDRVVASHLYTERERAALRRGAVHRLYTGNLRAGEHELVARFTGTDAHGRDVRRAASLVFTKEAGPKYLELKVVDREAEQRADFRVRAWE